MSIAPPWALAVTFLPLLIIYQYGQRLADFGRSPVRDLLIDPDVIILHNTPMSPLECNHRWPTVNLEHLPRKSWHHPLERLVATSEIRLFRVVELVGCDDRVVRADFQHVLCALGWTTVDGECVDGMVDGAPVGDVRLETGFHFPVLDEVLDEIRKRGCGVVLGFG